MAYQSTHIESGFGRNLSSLVAIVRGFFKSIGTAMIVSSSYNARAQMVQKLQAKSDEELAAMNIRREEIVHHVFRDLYYV
ncbi:hypothetical protein KX928_22275 [Roseobacter sp. YSTF-M11]|uniref:Uncharacterized protein n=1 Tax=Roseobacter insulae TaxID=2859783 RepID=A0A9X1G073_9RHOB|nr:hypothetical protein [Roseobacter insulae]MBW4710524.1 hypothetical protein [Roseobacter insulae]